MNERTGKILRWALILVLFGVGIFVGIVVFDKFIMRAYTRSGQTGPIPDVVGSEVDSARIVAERDGFELFVARKEHNDTIPEGIIISQRPEPGSTAKKGRRISAVVSLSSASGIVPDLSGIHRRAASLEIEKAGFSVGEIIEEYSDSVHREMVISTVPDSGTEIRLGSRVDLVVSKGPEEGLVPVPNFMGQLIEDAKDLAEQTGLKLEANYREIPSVPDNTVYRQTPGPGTRVERGNVVVVIVAREKEGD